MTETALGDCFIVALDFIVTLEDDAMPDWHRLCHGTPVGQGPIAGQRIAHAWVERDFPATAAGGGPNGDWPAMPARTIVIDLSNGAEVVMPREMYYRIGQIEEADVVRYTRREAIEHAVETMNYGPWGDE
jgi:hypothetical protein